MYKHNSTWDPFNNKCSKQFSLWLQKVDALQEALVNLLVVPKTEKEAARLGTVCADLQRVITEASTEAVNNANAVQDGQKGPEATKWVHYCIKLGVWNSPHIELIVV